MNRSIVNLTTTLQAGVVAGAAGGCAEIAWVSLYAQASGANAGSVARAVTTASGVIAVFPDAPVAAGIAIHMALALGLGIALALAWRALAPRFGVGANPYAFALSALAAVWAMNFFVVLPVIGSDFGSLMPYPVSLASKLLFGAAAAEVLRRGLAPVQTPVALRIRSSR